MYSNLVKKQDRRDLEIRVSKPKSKLISHWQLSLTL